MFPPSTIDFIGKEVGMLPASSVDSIEALVDAIYERVGKLKYGVQEALETWTHFRYPDAIVEQANCAEAAVFVYLLAKYAGLSPSIMRIVDIDGRGADHLSVIAPINGEYTIIDPFYKMKGSVEFYADRVDVVGDIIESEEDFTVRKIRSYSFSELEFMNEDELLEHISQLNEPGGFFMYLQGSQQVGTKQVDDGIVQTFLRYDEASRTFEVTLAHKGVFGFYAVNRLVYANGIHSYPRSEFYLAEGFDWNRVINPFFHATYDFVEDEEVKVAKENLPVSLEQEEQVLCHILYWAIDRKNDSGLYVYPEDKHKEFLKLLPSFADASKSRVLSAMNSYLESNDSAYMEEKFPSLHELRIDSCMALALLDIGRYGSCFSYARSLLKKETGLRTRAEIAGFVADDYRTNIIVPAIDDFFSSDLAKRIWVHAMLNAETDSKSH